MDKVQGITSVMLDWKCVHFLKNSGQNIKSKVSIWSIESTHLLFFIIRNHFLLIWQLLTCWEEHRIIGESDKALDLPKNKNEDNILHCIVGGSQISLILICGPQIKNPYLIPFYLCLSLLYNVLMFQEAQTH